MERGQRNDLNTQHSGNTLGKIWVTVTLFCWVAATWLVSALPITLPRMLEKRGIWEVKSESSPILHYEWRQIFMACSQNWNQVVSSEGPQETAAMLTIQAWDSDLDWSLSFLLMWSWASYLLFWAQVSQPWNNRYLQQAVKIRKK